MRSKGRSKANAVKGAFSMGKTNKRFGEMMACNRLISSLDKLFQWEQLIRNLNKFLLGIGISAIGVVIAYS